MGSSLLLLAGTVSTVVFAWSTLPMLRKAAVTKDLASYSLGNIVMANIGNVVHSIYVFHLPMGPIWVLHGFYLVSSAPMLFWYVRFAGPSSRLGVHTPAHAAVSKMRALPDAHADSASLA
jgi:uncharacterized protein with PQ loop repeat